MADFNMIYSQYFPNGDPSAFAAYVFKCFDTDNDGKVSFSEFLLTLNTTAKSSQQDQIKWAFALYDTDKDGLISRDDMFNIVKVIEKFEKILINSEIPFSRFIK